MKKVLLIVMATCSILWTYGQNSGIFAESVLDQSTETVKKVQPAAPKLSAQELARIVIPNIQNANEPKGNRNIYHNQNFDAPFTGTPAAPAGWTQARFVQIGTGAPTANGVDGEKDWQQNTWTGTAWAIPGYGTGIKPTGAVSGNGVLYMEDSYFGSTASWLGWRRVESPVINLATSTTPYVRFFYFYAAASSNLNVRVMASADGGTTWKAIMLAHPNSDVTGTMATTTPWQRINVLIPSEFRTATAKFGIEVTNTWGTNDIYLDDFSVEEFTPTTITSAASGNWSDAATWVGGVVPNANNHVVIAAGHTVNSNVNIARCQNVTVNGTFQYGTTTTQFNHIYGDLTINAGGVYNSFSGTTGKRTMIGGSLINNGTINFSIGAGNLVWVGGAPATYSGTGSISTFISNTWHVNSGGVTYNAPVEVRNVVGLYNGPVNPNGNLTVGNIAVTTQTVERTSIGFLTQAPIWTAGITRTVNYITANLAPATKTTITTGHDFPIVAGVGIVGGTFLMSTHDNVQLNVPVDVGTATTGALTLTRGVLITSTTNILTLSSFIAGPAGTAPSILTPPTTHGSYVAGPMRINFPATGTTARNFALGVGTGFNGATPNSNVLKTVTFASTADWASVALRVSIVAAPSGTATSPLSNIMGTRAYRVERIGTTDLPAVATIAIRANNYTFGNSDGLTGDLSQIRVAQATSLTGPWAERSVSTGTGSIVTNTYYTYTTATAAPGPISPLATRGEFFAFGLAGAPAVFNFSPSSLSFGTVNIGATSPAQTVIMSNTGGTPLTVTSVATTGPNAAEFILTDANTYPLTLPGSVSRTFNVALRPTSAGGKTATVVMTTSLGTHQIALSGTAMVAPPAPRNLTAATIPSGVRLNWQPPLLPSGGPESTTDIPVANTTAPTLSKYAGPAADFAPAGGINVVTPHGSKNLGTRALLYNNGPFINAPGQGPSGSDGSVLQSALAMTTLGSSAAYPGFRVADDFVVTSTWSVQSFTFYGYQTGSTITSTFTGGYLQIWDGDPTVAGSQVVWGTLAVNRMTATSWTGAYRYSSTSVGTTRPIMQVVCSTPGLVLAPGTYWVDYGLTGTVASGPWVVPITINGQATTGNAKQFNNSTSTWANLNDGGSLTQQGLPFLVDGTSYNVAYNVYRNGVKIANNISAVTYSDAPVAPDTYTYGVTAVYGAPNPGESNPIEITVSVGIFPLAESFESTTFPPTGWTVFDADGATPIWVSSTAYNNTPGGTRSAFHNYGAAGAYQKGWLISRLVALPAATNIELSFWSYNTFPTYYGNNSVWVSTTAASPAVGNYTQVWTTSSVTAAWVKSVVDLTAFAGQNVWIAFHYQGDNAHGWYLDDVRVDPRYQKDLAATKVTGSITPTAGTATNYIVTVNNLGLAAQTTYTVSLFRQGGVLIGTKPGVAINPNQEIDFSFAWTPATATNTFLYGVVTLEGDANTANNTSPNLNVEVFPVGTVAVTIGTGTTLPAIRIPFDFYYKNSLVQSIYFAEEIGNVGGFLKGITYFNSFTTNLPNKDVKIWVGTTTWNDLSGGWVAPASLTLVYDGKVNFPSGTNSIYIPFTTPFLYTGGNLVVYTNRVWEDVYFNSNDKFFGTQTTNRPGRSRNVSADATVYNPLTPPTPAASQLSDWHPNTNLIFQLAYGNVQGIVRDASSNNPILGAQVILNNQTIVTLANGAFAFNDIQIGTYPLTVHKPGYASVTRQITILANQTITENVALVKEAVVPGAMMAVLNPSQTAVNLNWGLPNGAYEIIYDDGTAENHVAWQLAGNMNALRFTPASYPVNILRGSVNIGNGTFPPNGNVLVPFQMAVFDDDGPNGFPGTQLGVTTVTPTATGWVNFNLAPLNITLPSGDFYLAMIQGGNFPNCAPIAINQTNPVMRSYSRLVTGGGAWAVAGTNDFMIRAVVQSPGGMPGMALNSYFIGYEKPQPGLIFQNDPISVEGWVGDATYMPVEGSGDQFRNLLGYTVFRLLEGQESNEASWTMIGNPTNPVFVDNAWLTLSDNSYRWAVKARYVGGSVSGAVISNILRKNYLSNVTVRITLSDPVASPAGTRVTLTNNALSQYNYTAVAGANGVVNFPAVVKGAYTLNVLLDFYNPHTAQVSIMTNTMTINVNLLETTFPPSNLVVNPITLVATWNQASPPFPEVIANFNNGQIPTGWTVTSNGNAPLFKWQVIPDLGGSSLNGTPFVIANSDAAGSGTITLDEYLTSPVINCATQPSVVLEFDQYYRHLGTGSFGRVEVFNGTAWITVLEQTATAGSWTAPDKRIIDLTAHKNAQFQVRFRYFDNSVWAWYWAIDNIKISRGSTGTRSVTGYRVYLDGVLKGTTTSTTFTYNPREVTYGQSYLAGVEAVYQSGVSARITHQFTSLYLFKPCNLTGADIGHAVRLNWQAPGTCVSTEAVTFPFPLPGANQNPLPVLIAQSAKENTNVKGIADFAYIPGGVQPLPETQAVLFNNGPLITNSGAGPGGSHLSVLQGNLSMTTLGAGAQQTAGNSVADDFTVTGNWNVENVELFSYQTGSTTTSTITGAFLRIYNGNPSTTGTVIWGDLTTNRMTSTNWSNIYRVSNTTMTDVTRPIMRVVCSTPGLVLPAGTYWIEYTLTGSLASGPWVPPITIVGQTTTGNALQRTSTGWAALNDGGTLTPQGVPFIINGIAGSPPVATNGFNVYRGGLKIGSTASNTFTYTDQPLVAGTYTYTVTALYQMGANLVESPHEGPISVVVAPGPGFVQGVIYNNVSNVAIAGATVTAGTFSTTSLANGTYMLIAFEGPYNIRFSAAGYDDLVVPLTVVWNQTLTLNVGLTPRVPGITVSPTSFTIALPQNQTTTRTINVSNPGLGILNYSTSVIYGGVPTVILNEGFEGATFPPTGWLKMNPDGGTGWTSITAGTTPIPGWTGGTATAAPDGGTKMTFCTWNTGGAASNDQWLTTPRFTVSANSVLTFHVRRYSAYVDKLEIKLSTGVQNSPAAYTIMVGEIAFTATSTQEWELRTYNLGGLVAPGTQVHLGFREVVADNNLDGAAIFIDNVRVIGQLGWLSVAPPSGSVAAGANTNLTATINTAGLTPGTYTSTLRITSNAPTSPTNVNFTLGVTGVGVGIDDPLAESVLIYPVPASNILNIQMGDNIRNIRMINYLGQVMTEQDIKTAGTYTLDVKNLNNGAYLIQFVTKEGETFTRKVVVTK